MELAVARTVDQPFVTADGRLVRKPGAEAPTGVQAMASTDLTG